MTKVLDRLMVHLGLPPQNGLTFEHDPESGLNGYSSALKKSSIASTVFRAPVGAAVRSLSRGRPLVAMDNAGQPIIIVRKVARRIKIEESDGRTSWMTPAELVSLLGLARSQQEHSWLSVDNPPNDDAGLHHNTSPWRNVLSLIAGEKQNVTAITIYAAGVGILSLALPLAVQTLVNSVAFGQLLQPIFSLTMMLAAGLVFSAILRASQVWVVEVLQRRIFVQLVSQISARLPRVDIKAFDQGLGPELLNRFFDIFTAQKALSGILIDGVGAFLIAVAGMTVLAFYHPSLLAFGIVLSVMTVFTLGVAGRGATRSTIDESKSKYAVAGWLQEMARHPFALKIAGGGKYAHAHTNELSATWLRHRASHFRIFYRQLVGAFALQVIAHASLLGVGGTLVVQHELSVGQLVAAELIVTAVIASMTKLAAKLETLYDLVAAADKLGALLSIELEQDDGKDELDCSKMPRIILANVCVKDGCLTNSSFVIERGECVAVDSNRKLADALVEMLFGLRMPVSGSVRIDEQDLRDVSKSSLRAHVAVVRGAEVLPVTIAENVRMSEPNISTSAIWALMQTVGLEGVVRALPQGIQTALAPSGYPLNRLEATRLTLARALAGSPSLLVLDGMLDRIPRREREALLIAASKGRTTLITTNEPGVAKYCDRILQPISMPLAIEEEQ